MGMFTIGPPPQRTGDTERDLDRLYGWCGQVAAFLTRQSNYTGTVRKQNGQTGEEEQNAN